LQTSPARWHCSSKRVMAGSICGILFVCHTRYSSEYPRPLLYSSTRLWGR
jgi:hypothetical protein